MNFYHNITGYAHSARNTLLGGLAAIVAVCSLAGCGATTPPCPEGTLGKASAFTVRESATAVLKKEYDIIVGSCIAGTVTGTIFPPKYSVEADGKLQSRVDQTILSPALEGTIYANGEKPSAKLNYRVVKSIMGVGSYYEFSYPAGGVFGVLKSDWLNINSTIFSGDGQELMLAGTIEHPIVTATDTYNVAWSGKPVIDNASLAGVIAMIDAVNDAAESSSSDDSSDNICKAVIRNPTPQPSPLPMPENKQ